jgi:hypothetical protein
MEPAVWELAVDAAQRAHFAAPDSKVLRSRTVSSRHRIAIHNDNCEPEPADAQPPYLGRQLAR